MANQKTSQTKTTEASEKKHAPNFAKSPAAKSHHPVDTILQLQQTIGNQAVQKLLKSGVLQAKLKIGQPGDKYEQEADRIADLVMRMPEPRVHRFTEEEDEEFIQPKPLAGQITRLTQTKAGEGEVSPELESRIHALKGGGQPLPKPTRDFFEPRFGIDLSGVRVHMDKQAAEAAQAVNARAFTVGPNITFGRGQYSPNSIEGKRLLAHELTHVMQQSNIPQSSPVSTASPSKPKEKKAEMLAWARDKGRGFSTPKYPKSIGADIGQPRRTSALSSKELAVMAGDLAKAHNYVNDYFRNAIDSLTIQAIFYNQLFIEVASKTKKPDAGLAIRVLWGILLSVIKVGAPEIAPIAAWAMKKGTLGEVFVKVGARASALLLDERNKDAVAERAETVASFVTAEKKSVVENLYDGATKFQVAEGKINDIINATYDFIKDYQSSYREGSLVSIAETLGENPVLKNKEVVRREFFRNVYLKFVNHFGVMLHNTDTHYPHTFDPIKRVIVGYIGVAKVFGDGTLHKTMDALNLAWDDVFGSGTRELRVQTTADVARAGIDITLPLWKPIGKPRRRGVDTNYATGKILREFMID